MSDDEYTIYDKATLAFQKLEPNPGDVLVIYFPDDIHPAQMMEFASGLKPHIPEDCVLLCARHGVKIEKFPEAAMNEKGWYRFDPKAEKH